MKAFLLAGIASAMLTGRASATPITATYDFTSTFSSGPYSTVDGSFAVSFDPTISQTASPVVTFTSNLPLVYSPVEFFFYNGTLEVGNNCSGLGCSASYNKDQFYFVLQISQSGFVYDAKNFDLSDGSSLMLSSSFTAVEVPTVASVPEPSSLAALGVGLLGLTAMYRRKKA